jgi:hypothetical protein
MHRFGRPQEARGELILFAGGPASLEDLDDLIDGARREADQNFLLVTQATGKRSALDLLHIIVLHALLNSSGSVVTVVNIPAESASGNGVIIPSASPISRSFITSETPSRKART